ncbi:receptor-like protein kinase FERONIA [Tripterygium wilfordii]|uniref:Receptor-like protein kinase FERONIA n=1 Tax=Tripterygium wilfordii TaxID=458696 RepID=A0A7J7DMU7_TRIWF|nr:receptor-like protein kinase FERONIA [Tripterygium wilfordii]
MAVKVSMLAILCLASTIFAADYVPTEKILLNCGAPADSTDGDNLKWTTDLGSKFLSSEKSSTSVAATQDPAVSSVPFMTARVFQSDFTYSIPVASGRKFVRLYFYSNSYNGRNATDALFSVTSGSYTLLKNFSVAQTSDALNLAYIVKEYSINVDGAWLNITFSPSSNSSKAYAFANGIEVLSMPDIYSSTDGTLTVVGSSSSFTIDNTTALENVYRLNVGGNDISPSGDTGMLRSWSNDMPYIRGAALGVTVTADSNVTIKYPSSMPTYLAPLDVYATARSMGPDPNLNVNYNLTWIFSVDSGFSYLFRLHFCELADYITKINQRVFDIFLLNQTAESGADVIAWTGDNGNGIPFYKDYVVLVPGGGAQQDVWLALHPNEASKSQYYDSILNGVEIFKLSDTNDNLAGPNPIAEHNVIDPSKVLPPSHVGHSKNKTAVIAGGISAGIVAALIIAFCFVGAARWRRDGKEASASDGPSGWLPLSLYGNSHSAGSAKTNTTGKESGQGISGLDDEEVPFTAGKGKNDPDASPGYDGIVTDSKSSGMSMSIGGRSLASDDSDGLTPSAVFSQIMNPKGR